MTEATGTTGRPARRFWVAASVLLITILQRETSFMPWEVFLPLLMASALAVLWWARDRLPSIRELLVAAALVGASLGIAAIPFFLSPDLSALLRVSVSLPSVIAGAVVLLLLLAREGEGGRDQSPAWSEPQAGSVKQRLILLAGVFVFLALAHWSIQRDYLTFFDEVLYVLQGRLMEEPGYVRRIDETLSRFFVLRQSIFSDGRFYTQYTPGLPALLAAADAAGLRWWLGVTASTAGAAFTYLAGRELHSEFVGRVAALLLVTTSYFIVYGTSFMPHSSSLALVTAAAWLLLRAERRTDRAALLGWAAAGGLLGIAVTVRPVTGAALTMSLLLWQVARRGHAWRGLMKPTAGLVAGLVPPILGLLYYNAVTNGDPLLFGYTAIHGTLHDLGFGVRGFVVPDGSGRWTTELTDFTFGRAVFNSLIVATSLVSILLPVFLLAPTIVLASHRAGYRFRWSVVAAFLALPVVQFAYFYPHTRFYIELFPFLFLGFAGMLDHLRRRDRWLARAILISLLAAQVLLAGLDIWQRAHERQRSVRHNAIAAVQQAHEAQGNLLIFVANGGNLFHWLSWFNIDEFPGPIIIARDLGPENQRLIRQFPTHLPLRAAIVGQGLSLHRLP